jgi:hypothetical protein
VIRLAATAGGGILWRLYSRRCTARYAAHFVELPRVVFGGREPEIETALEALWLRV